MLEGREKAGCSMLITVLRYETGLRVIQAAFSASMQIISLVIVILVTRSSKPPASFVKKASDKDKQQDDE